MQDDNEIKSNSIVLDAGAATPINIKPEDAISIAKEQQAYQQNFASLEENGTLYQEEKPDQGLAEIISVDSNAATTVNQNMVNQVNDIVKVSEKKTQPKVYILMILAIIVIIGIIFWEVYHYVIQGG